MRTSLNKIKAIDDFLSGNMAAADALVFEANRLLHKDLADDVRQQQNAHAMIRLYGRQSIRAEIKAVQQALVSEPQHQSFMQRIINLFKNS